VLIELADTGCGMSSENLTQAFEPFFSTKGAGHGSGLSLSMVHGFVHQSGGVIRMTSVPGVGTSVRIFIPRVLDRKAAASAEQQGAPVVAPSTPETVLVVEDNEFVRASTVGQLQSLGYDVSEAVSGDAALRLLEHGEPRIDLVFSDIIMPGHLDGYALSRLVIERWPATRVLLTSGFSDGLDVEGQDADVPTLAKPYRKAQLAHAVRVALDSSPGRGAGTAFPGTIEVASSCP
jgi:CheY-like chemotaxis protein